MSEYLFKVFGLALIAAMTITLFRKWGSDFGVLLKVAAGALVAAACVSGIAPIVEYMRSLGEASLPWETVEGMLRILAVAMVTHICATICRDCGEATLGGYLELGGKVEIIALTLPMIKEIVEVMVGIL
jgi:stage III sporulation protein AD